MEYNEIFSYCTECGQTIEPVIEFKHDKLCQKCLEQALSIITATHKDKDGSINRTVIYKELP
jgi:NMD protein affecting ribosome stability and mRNA decay